MALLFLDSFDHYLIADIGKKYLISGSIDMQATGGRRGTQAVRLTSWNTWIKAILPAVGNTVIMGMALKLTNFNASGNEGVFGIQSGSTTQLQITVNASGFFEVRRGTTLIGTALIGNLIPNVYYYVEMKAVIHPTAGTVVLRVNEVPVLSIPPTNTSASGTQTWNNIFFTGSLNFHTYVDDVYVLDGSGPTPVSAETLNDFLGDCRVDAKRPTAEGATSEWVPLSSPPSNDNADMVNDITPDDDVTYNQSDLVGRQDTFIMQDVTESGAYVYGVQVVLSQKKSDAGLCSIAPVYRHSDGREWAGTESNPSTTYTFRLAPLTLNPVTNLPWTQADFNSGEFGYRRIS